MSKNISLIEKKRLRAHLVQLYHPLIHHLNLGTISRDRMSWGDFFEWGAKSKYLDWGEKLKITGPGTWTCYTEIWKCDARTVMESTVHISIFLFSLAPRGTLLLLSEMRKWKMENGNMDSILFCSRTFSVFQPRISISRIFYSRQDTFACTPSTL